MTAADQPRASSDRLIPDPCNSMDCRDFRKNHLAFVDNTMPDADLVAMQRHLAECEGCSRQDTAVRRGLLVFRNLPTIEPSPDFTQRLHSKLQHVQYAESRAQLYRGPGVGAFLTAAAGVLGIGFLTSLAIDSANRGVVPMLAPVVATVPEMPAAVNNALVVPATAGLPAIWPAALLAEQAPARLVNAELVRFANGR